MLSATSELKPPFLDRQATSSNGKSKTEKNPCKIHTWIDVLTVGKTSI